MLRSLVGSEMCIRDSLYPKDFLITLNHLILTIAIVFVTPITAMIYFIATKLLVYTYFVITLKFITTIIFITVIITIITVITNQIHADATSILTFEFILLAKMIYIYEIKFKFN